MDILDSNYILLLARSYIQWLMNSPVNVVENYMLIKDKHYLA